MKLLLGIPETYNFQWPWAIKLQHEDHLKLGPPNLHSSQGFRENVNSQNEPCQLTENFIWPFIYFSLGHKHREELQVHRVAEVDRL